MTDPPIPRDIAARMVTTARERFRLALAAGNRELAAAWRRYGEYAKRYV